MLCCQLQTRIHHCKTTLAMASDLVLYTTCYMHHNIFEVCAVFLLSHCHTAACTACEATVYVVLGPESNGIALA